MTASAVVHVWSDEERRAICEQVDRILASDAFAQSQRRRTFLSYIVAELLSGRGDRIKAYTVAIEVFDREKSFDSAANPLVRIEASRLRDKLRAYYARDGALDPILIDVPKGSYVPLIEFRKAIPLGPPLADDAARDVETHRTEKPSQLVSIGSGPSIAVLPFVNMSAKRAGRLSLRRHHREYHHRSVALPRPLRRRQPLGLFLQKQTVHGSRDCTRARRQVRARRQRAEIQRARNHHRAAHRWRHRRTPLGRTLRPILP
ncbi:MAG: hypothetical protein WDN31_22880 [Hyphomicrobium sp.]